MARVFIGVAWPYANSHIHIGGFAGVYLPADIFARFRRLAGDEVLMVSGSDAHGTPILVVAPEHVEGGGPLTCSGATTRRTRRSSRSSGSRSTCSPTRTPRSTSGPSRSCSWRSWRSEE